MIYFLRFMLRTVLRLCVVIGVRVDFYMTPIEESLGHRKLGIKFSKGKKSYGVVAVLTGQDVSTLTRTEIPY